MNAIATTKDELQTSATGTVATNMRMFIEQLITEEPVTTQKDVQEQPEERASTLDELLFNWGLLQTYGTQLLDSEQMAVEGNDGMLRTLPERVAEFLVEESMNGKNPITGLSTYAIAEQLGTYRETVVSILRAFQRQGFIKISYNSIYVADMNALEEIAYM
ncbi:MAG: helix-turn-helix domain-containing protein [Chloroflexota bacterium]